MGRRKKIFRCCRVSKQVLLLQQTASSFVVALIVRRNKAFKSRNVTPFRYYSAAKAPTATLGCKTEMKSLRVIF